MKKTFCGILLLSISFLLSGCSQIGDKAASITIVYGVTAVLSLLLLIGYCCLIRKKENWFFLLFTAVFVVNCGYFCLSIASTLEEALLANRISYLGSVFLPMAMFMIILNISKIRIPKALPVFLILISVVVFFIAASPGYLDIYYKDVSLETVNGVTILIKVYGPWHCTYLFYLIGYFAAMIAISAYTIFKKKISAALHAMILAVSVFVNIGVWLLEQLVELDFEFLSISYIITELFLLSLYLMLQENIVMVARQAASKQEAESAVSSSVSPLPEKEPEEAVPDELAERRKEFLSDLKKLTPTETVIYHCYLKGMSTKEILTELNIKENTLKYHNRNLYGKLDVSSRKQLLETVNVLNIKKEEAE